MRIGTHGSTIPFQARPWAEISAFLAAMATRDREFAHMGAIAGSVTASGVAGPGRDHIDGIQTKRN